MAFLTVNEFYNLTLGEVDDRIYRRIENEFRKFLGDKAAKFLESHLSMTIAQFAACSVVNVMANLWILG